MAFDFSNLDCSKVKVDTWGSKPNGNDCYWNIAKNQLGTDATNAEIAQLTAQLQAKNSDKEMLYTDDEVLVTAETALQSISNNLTSATNDLNNFQDAANTAQDALTTASGEVASTLAAFNSIDIPEPAYKEEKGEDGKTVKTQTNANEIAAAKAAKEAAQAAYEAALEQEAAAKEQVEAAKSDLESAKNTLEDIKNEYEAAKKECDDAELEADKNKQKMDEIDKQIADLESQLDDAKQKAAEMEEQEKVAENNQKLGKNLDFTQDKDGNYTNLDKDALQKAVDGTSAVMFNTNDKGEITETKLDAKGNVSTYKVTKDDDEVKNGDKTNTIFTLTAAENATSSKEYDTTAIGEYEEFKGKIGSTDENDIKQYDLDGDGKITYADSIFINGAITFTDDNFDELFGNTTDKKDTTASGANGSDDKKTDSNTAVDLTKVKVGDTTKIQPNGKSDTVEVKKYGNDLYLATDGTLYDSKGEEVKDSKENTEYSCGVPVQTTTTFTDDDGNKIEYVVNKTKSGDITSITTETYDKDGVLQKTETKKADENGDLKADDEGTKELKPLNLTTDEDGNKIKQSDINKGDVDPADIAQKASDALDDIKDKFGDDFDYTYFENLLSEIENGDNTANIMNNLTLFENAGNELYKLNNMGSGGLYDASLYMTDDATNNLLDSYLKDLKEIDIASGDYNTNKGNLGNVINKYDTIIDKANNLAGELKDKIYLSNGNISKEGYMSDFVSDLYNVSVAKFNNTEGKKEIADKYERLTTHLVRANNALELVHNYETATRGLNASQLMALEAKYPNIGKIDPQYFKDYIENEYEEARSGSEGINELSKYYDYVSEKGDGETRQTYAIKYSNDYCDMLNYADYADKLRKTDLSTRDDKTQTAMNNILKLHKNAVGNNTKIKDDDSITQDIKDKYERILTGADENFTDKELIAIRKWVENNDVFYD